jgi:hypothetical protein
MRVNDRGKGEKGNLGVLGQRKRGQVVCRGGSWVDEGRGRLRRPRPVRDPHIPPRRATQASLENSIASQLVHTPCGSYSRITFNSSSPGGSVSLQSSANLNSQPVCSCTCSMVVPG